MEDIALTSLLDKLREILSDEILTKVLNIGKYIEESGMSLSDCALLSRVSDKELETLSDRYPEIKVFFRLKRVKHKYGLLKVLNTQVKDNKDAKMATYLLENNYSDEYDPTIKRETARRKNKKSDGGNEVEELINFIRQSSPNSPVIEANTLGQKEVDEEKKDLDLAHLVHG